MAIKISNRFRGYLWAFASILAVSNVYIFSKAALNIVHIAQFGFYWFLLGLLWNLIFASRTCKLTTFKNLSRKQLALLVIIGLIEIGATTSFFYAISIIENPSITSFLGNLSPIFVTVLGVSLLKERYNYIEVIGILLTLAGAIIISYQGRSSIEGIFLRGTEFVALASFLFAISNITIKKNIVNLPPALMALNRTFFLFVYSFIMMLVFSKSFVIPQSALLSITIGSILGPFLTVVAGYMAYQYIEASRSSILGSTKSLFVLVGAYIYFSMFPTTIQIIGGLITIVGVLLISFGKMILGRKK